jgi:hypothetical protein
MTAHTSAAQRFLFDGLADVKQEGVPGVVAIFGDDAFPLLISADGHPLTACAFFSQGRVIAIAHDGYLKQPLMPFIDRCVQWVSGSGNSPQVLQRAQPTSDAIVPSHVLLWRCNATLSPQLVDFVRERWWWSCGCMLPLGLVAIEWQRCSILPYRKSFSALAWVGFLSRLLRRHDGLRTGYFKMVCPTDLLM